MRRCERVEADLYAELMALVHRRNKKGDGVHGLN
jgi:hypothetical protein